MQFLYADQMVDDVNNLITQPKGNGIKRPKRLLVNDEVRGTDCMTAAVSWLRDSRDGHTDLWV